MPTIAAVYENGVFRPTGPVDLPEGAVVNLTPAQEVLRPASEPLEVDENSPEYQANLDQLYELLSRRYHGGDPYVSERHNEHQP